MRLEIGAKKEKEKVNNFMGSASKTNRMRPSVRTSSCSLLFVNFSQLLMVFIRFVATSIRLPASWLILPFAISLLTLLIKASIWLIAEVVCPSSTNVQSFLRFAMYEFSFCKDASPSGYCCRAVSFSPTPRQLLLHRKWRQIPFYAARSMSIDPMSRPMWCYWGSRFG